MSTAAWDIYAEQLISLGYGYPLWVPDPAPGQAPIQIGDVGWVHEGEFHVLFNALREAHDAQPMDAVPANFAPLNPKGLQIWGPREKIWQRVLCSRTIHRRDISGGAMVNGPAPSGTSGSVDFNFRCSGDSGAFLMVNPRAMTHDILSERAVANYMNANFDSWLSFANDAVGLNIREDDIRFVTGTTTTAQWAVAAFRSSCRNKQGTLTCSLAGTGTASFSMSISDEALPTSHYRVGPPKLQPTHPSPHTTLPSGMPSESILPHSPEEMTYDQCIFVHTLKRKKRLEKFLRFLKAGAGPDELPRNPDDTEFEPQLLSSAADVEFEGDVRDLAGLSSQGDIVEYVTEPTRFEVKDPVDILLNYILEHSSARTAIASEKDLYKIFASQYVEWPDPDDFKKTLDKIPVTIHVDSNGVGSVQILRNAKAQGKLKAGAGDLYDHDETTENFKLCPLHDIVCAKGTCLVYDMHVWKINSEMRHQELERWRQDAEKRRQEFKKQRQKLEKVHQERMARRGENAKKTRKMPPGAGPRVPLASGLRAYLKPGTPPPQSLIPTRPLPPHLQRRSSFGGPAPPSTDGRPTPTALRSESKSDGVHSEGSSRGAAEALALKNYRDETKPTFSAPASKSTWREWSNSLSIFAWSGWGKALPISAPSVKGNNEDLPKSSPAISVVEDADAATARPERAWGSWAIDPPVSASSMARDYDSWSMDTPSVTTDWDGDDALSVAASDDSQWGEPLGVAAPARPGHTWDGKDRRGGRGSSKVVSGPGGGR